MIGKHPATLAIMQAIDKAAHTDRHVLITGETGTGKELIANAIQQQSRRNKQVYIQINCTVFHPGSVGRPLAGYRQELFADAKQRGRGLIEEATGGTLLLDEIESLPLPIQAKLSLFIDQNNQQTNGKKDDQSRKSNNVRLLAVSNADLRQRVEEGLFRPDLFFRLNAIQLHAPALRERKSDIPLLIGYYLGKMSKRHAAPCPSLTRDTLDRLIDYPWPGNIRELRNVCENLVVRRLSDKVRPEQLPINQDEIGKSYSLFSSQEDDLSETNLQVVSVG